MMTGLSINRGGVTPHSDQGFFGPGSMTWRVWSYPAAALIGFQRAVTIEELDPHLIAAVEDAGGVRYRPATRYDRTLHYFALVAFGDTATTARAADVLVKIHSKAIGTDPVTGARYDANDPGSQLWIHMTAWHSILYSYEKFGGGRLTAAEEDQYWAECARAAELQTIDPADVPRNRAEVRAYFEAWRPRLVGSETAQSMTEFLLKPGTSFSPKMSRVQRLAFLPVAHLVRWATVSTYPDHIRKLFGLPRMRVRGRLARAVLIPGFRVAAVRPEIALFVLKNLSPSTVAVAAPVLLGIPATAQVTMTPREAQKLYGYDAPADAHRELRARQDERVFGQGESPSDEGLVESQTIIGALDTERLGQLA